MTAHRRHPVDEVIVRGLTAVAVAATVGAVCLFASEQSDAGTAVLGLVVTIVGGLLGYIGAHQSNTAESDDGSGGWGTQG